MGVDQQCSPLPESIARKDWCKHVSSHLPGSNAQRKSHAGISAISAVELCVSRTASGLDKTPLLLLASKEAKLRVSRVKKVS